MNGKNGNLLKNFSHDDVIKWKPFPRYWPFVRGIHRSPVTSPHEGQWRGALVFCLIWAWINAWVNNPKAGDFRRHRAHYDVIVMESVPVDLIKYTSTLARVMTTKGLYDIWRCHWTTRNQKHIYKCIISYHPNHNTNLCTTSQCCRMCKFCCDRIGFRKIVAMNNLIVSATGVSSVVQPVCRVSWWYGSFAKISLPIRWRHNKHDGVSNHQPHDCLLNRLFRHRSKKTSKLRVTGLCVGNSPVTGEFPAQMASYAENVSIWWRHHEDPAKSSVIVATPIINECVQHLAAFV